VSRPVVLYLVNRNSATSVSLETAAHIDRERFDLLVAAYYHTPVGEISSLSLPIIEIGARSVADPRALRALYRLIGSHRPDVVHVHHTISSTLASALGKLLHTPVLVDTEHHDRRDLSLRQRVATLPTLALSDVIICNSNNTCRSFSRLEKRVTAGRRLTIYNGVDVAWLDRCRTDRESVRQRYGLGMDDFLIGNVGRLVPQKDQQSLIHAMSLVVRALPAAKLVIVGGGPLQARLTTLVHRLGLEEQVILTGGLRRERVYEFLHAADLFVMCSLWEGFCNALVEAMAAGKPVVATDVGPLPEVVGSAGCLVPPRSPATLADAVLGVAAMPSESRRRLGAAARRRVVENFTVERTAQSYGRVYMQALGRKAGA